MSLITTSLHVNYQPQWTLSWAIREILSNAIDGETRHKVDGRGQMVLSYNRISRRLFITNEGVSVPLKALLLGTSESRDRSDCIGTFGEGLPMALLVLARNHYPVTIYNGIEKWEPLIEMHPELDEKVLVIKTRQMIKDRGHFSVEIDQIEEDDYVELRRLFLRFDPVFDAKQTINAATKERVLLQSSYKGRVYNKGVFVCSRPKLLFGYDLQGELNRDRSMVDESELQSTLGNVLADAVSNDKNRFLPLLESVVFTDGEALEVSDSWGKLRYNDDMKKHFAARFAERYGIDAIPVADANEAQQASEFGKTGITGSPLLRQLLDSGIPTLASLRSKSATSATRNYARHELTTEAQANLAASITKLMQLVPAMPNVRAVVFGSSTIKSVSRSDGSIDVASSVLEDKEGTLLALTRELVIQKKTPAKSWDPSSDIMASLASLVFL